MTLDRQRRIEGLVALVLFALTIPAANWLIGNAGTVCVPNGSCLVPVWQGIKAPSGVLMIGLALVLRDIVQRRLGAAAGLGEALDARKSTAGRAAVVRPAVAGQRGGHPDAVVLGVAHVDAQAERCGRRLQRLLGMAHIDHIMKDDAAIAVHGIDDLADRRAQ